MGLAFAVRSTGCDSRSPGEPQVVAAIRASVAAHAHCPLHSRHGACHVCRVGRLSAFAAAGRSEPHSVQPTPPEPAPSKSLVGSDSSAHRREAHCGDSGVGRQHEAAIVDARRTVYAGDLVDIAGVDILSPQFHLRALAARGFRFYTPPAATRMDGTVGRRGALIFEGIRARLPAESAAMAASRAPRSTQ